MEEGVDFGRRWQAAVDTCGEVVMTGSEIDRCRVALAGASGYAGLKDARGSLEEIVTVGVTTRRAAGALKGGGRRWGCGFGVFASFW